MMMALVIMISLLVVLWDYISFRIMVRARMF